MEYGRRHPKAEVTLLHMGILADGPVTNLNDLYLTLRPEPLISKKDLDHFYRGEVNLVRGDDTVARLSRKLQQAYEAVPFKTFVMGHPGVGKSTELSRLLVRVKDQHCGIRLSIATELNPASFKIFDVLLLMMIRLVEETQEMGPQVLRDLIPESLFNQIQGWFSTEIQKQTAKRTVGGEIEAGAGVKGGSVVGGLLGLFASVKGEIKYAGERNSETVEYRLKRVPELVELCNHLVDVCGRALEQKQGKQWLLIVEDFDKTGISPQQLQDLFINYGTVFQDLRVSMIFVIPVWLGYSTEANRLPFNRYLIHDTPVFDKRHEPHKPGRNAIRSVLDARMSSSLFAEDQMDRLIVASGGNIRDLFSLASDAGENALMRDPVASCITQVDCTAAINSMRREYRRRLGESPYDAQPITYEQKLQKLRASLLSGAQCRYCGSSSLFTAPRPRDPGVQRRGMVWSSPSSRRYLEATGKLETARPRWNRINAPGSIAEVVARLKLWCSKRRSGLARVEWDSVYARQDVLAQLKAALPVTELEVPSEKSAFENVNALLDQLAALPAGQVVSITGIEGIFPDSRKRLETLVALSFQRERLTSFELKQIWWIPSHLTEQLILGVPDLDSWFQLRLHLIDVPRPKPDQLETFEAISADSFDLGEARALEARFWERFASARSQGVPPIQIWSDLGEPAYEALSRAGLIAEAREILTALRDLVTAEVVGQSLDLSRLRPTAGLALALRETGDYARARRIQEQVVEASRRLLGEEHPDTLTAMSGLADNVISAGDLAGARNLEEQVVETRRRLLGASIRTP